MKKSIDKLKPEKLWKHFLNLSEIPRPSGYERAVTEHVKLFAKNNGLRYQTDEAGNLLIEKKAAEGKNQASPVILQAHLDMVPQKNQDKKHDFTRDSIQPLIDGEWVRADNTTLGADNGIGVAAAMAVLGSDTVKHGPLEVLFTIDEEAGMNGAFGLEKGILRGNILLNLDSEDEGELFTGCAGGIEACAKLKYNTEKCLDGKAFRIELKGLKGGHSGLDINLGRGNANKIMIRLLVELQKECDATLSSFRGGNLINAIPRESEVIVIIPVSGFQTFTRFMEEYGEQISRQYEGVETGLSLCYYESADINECVCAEDQHKILSALDTCPDGVIKMHDEIPDVVQTSTNLAMVNIENGICRSEFLLRSAVDKEKYDLGSQIEELFRDAGGTTRFSGDYPGWQPDTDSHILQKAKEIYRQLFNKKPAVKVVHAGLECGIIGDKYPGMDMISFGPTIKFPHSPDEKVHVESVERFWNFLIALLEEV